MDLKQVRNHRRNALGLWAFILFIGILAEIFDGKVEFIPVFSLIIISMILLWGVYFYSRFVSAILLCAVISASYPINLQDSEGWGAFAFGLVALYIFSQSLRASIAYHRLRKEVDPAYKSTRWWMWLVGIPVCLLALLGIGFEMYQQHPSTPSPQVQMGETLRPEVIESLHEAGIVDDDEEVLYFYSAHPFSFVKIGSVLTDRRIIAYKDKGEMSIHSSPYTNLLDVEIYEEAGISDVTVLRLYLEEGVDFYVFLPNDEDSEVMFLNALRERIPAKKK